MKRTDHLGAVIKAECFFGRLADTLNQIKLELKRLMNNMSNEESEAVKRLISICKRLSSLIDDILFLQEKYTIARKKK